MRRNIQNCILEKRIDRTVLTAALMLTGTFLFCDTTMAQVNEPLMSLAEYPVVDGSTACIPLCENLALRLTGCSQAEAEETLDSYSNTNPSYLHLAGGSCDIIFSYEPAQETVEELKAYDPLNSVPIGKDALVFITNVSNPVESLTVDQIRDIFAGEITNWSEVGGADMEIRAFQRPETSGSQTLMRKLVMGDTVMEESDVELVPTMEGMIEALKEYDNSVNSIGFSVYYYASQMYEQPDLKFLQIDGVEPSNDSIRSGKYPLINEFYCVTNEQSSDSAKKIQEWMVTEEGQQFVEECGYVAMQ